MADAVAPEFTRFVAAERRARRLAAAPAKPMAEGDVFEPVRLPSKVATEFLRIAARRASGLYRPSARTEVVWVEGENELAVGLAGLEIDLADGLIRLSIPVRCDQTGPATIEVVFAVGTAREPSGLYASTFRRPNGPPLITATWGESLVAFAWQCVLGMVSGMAGALGKDARGNVLVPVELSASRGALQIVPMARHRFAGASGLGTK